MPFRFNSIGLPLSKSMAIEIKCGLNTGFVEMFQHISYYILNLQLSGGHVEGIKTKEFMIFH